MQAVVVAAAVHFKAPVPVHALHKPVVVSKK